MDERIAQGDDARRFRNARDGLGIEFAQLRQCFPGDFELPFNRRSQLLVRTVVFKVLVRDKPANPLCGL